MHSSLVNVNASAQPFTSTPAAIAEASSLVDSALLRVAQDEVNEQIDPLDTESDLDFSPMYDRLCREWGVEPVSVRYIAARMFLAGMAAREIH